MKLTGGQIIIKYLESEQVPYALGIPGHGILGFFDALRQSDSEGKVRYIQVKHEQAATHVADAYFRLTGKPLAVFASIGPGSLNTTIGLGTAYVDSSAFLLLAGDTHVHMKGTGVLQEIERYQDSNFIRVLEPLTKRAWRAEHACQLPRIMQRAFNKMLTGRSGPIAVSLPMDVQADTIEATLPQPLRRRAMAKPAAHPSQLSQAVAIMEEAKRPVIVAGGAMLRSGAYEALVDLAERWGAAVVTTMAGKSAFPEEHPLCGLHTGSKGTPVGLALTRSADVILALGTRFADETTCSYREGVAFKKSARYIHVDIDEGEIGKNYPCEVGIVGDLATVLGQLLDVFRPDLKGSDAYLNTPYAREIAALNADWNKTLEKKRGVNFKNITISQLIGKLSECMPPEAIIATSSGNTQAQLFQEYRFKNPGTHLTTGGFSTMGWAMPAAIGACLARPDTPVFALLGDGDFMMVMQELATIAQYQIPVKIIVANNCGWMAIKDLQQDVLGSEYIFGNDWIRDGGEYTPDLVAIAKSFGIPAMKISRQDEVASAVRKALDENGPMFIEVAVHREYPDSGGDACGWWDLPIPGYLADQRAKYEDGKSEETLL